MKNIIFTLEETEVRRALLEEYVPLGLQLVDMEFRPEVVVGVFTPAAAPGPRFETHLDEATLAQVVSRRALRVTCMRVTSVKRIGVAELRVEAELADDSCPTCGQRVGQPTAPSAAPTVAAEPTAQTVAAGAPASAVASAPAAPPPSAPVSADVPGTAGRVLPLPSGRAVGFGDHELVTIPTLTLTPVATDGFEKFEVVIPTSMEVPNA